jgi:hypothetical protein
MPNNNPFMPGVSAPAPAPTNTPMPGAPTSPESYEIDLTNVQSAFTVPDGLYKVKCIDIEQSVSKGGNPMFIWTFEVSEGAHAGFQSKVFTAITPAAMWKVAETVQALGVGQTGQTVKFKRTDVIGKECGAMIETTEYNGQNRSQISRVLSMAELLASKEG